MKTQRVLQTYNEQDITEGAAREAALRTSEETAQALLDATDDIAVLKELQKRTEMLEVQNLRMLETVDRKSRFFASMSHELRSPMTSIIGFTEILLEDTEEPLTSSQRSLLLKVRCNAERLLDMINDLLDLSKIESGRMTVKVSRVNLPELIQHVVETMTPLVRNKDTCLETEVPDNLPIMRTDEHNLNKILVNLVSNAIKFTPKGCVKISAALKGSKINISVSDTGIGIRRADFCKIFEEFRQVGEHPVGSNGTGLGLAITKKLVHLLGGEIKVSSKLRQGSAFTVVLPVSLSATGGRARRTCKKRQSSDG
ncbi:MAG: HAMP domain-containing histidine kinase [Armatimonadetes bacterium]|nr:HAMP domain-containing histidine kinase [Armatimonadota bacterium]